MLGKMEFSAEKVSKNHFSKKFLRIFRETDFLRKKMYEKSAPDEFVKN
jgi:hypothetical protein